MLISSLQLSSVLDDFDIRVIKTGMLCDAETISIISARLKNLQHLPPIVCDPVTVSTSGHILLEAEAIKTLIEDMFPLSTLITPNKSEAELILSTAGFPSVISKIEEMITASRILLSLGPKAILLKGGHVIVSLSDVDRISETYPDVEIVKYALLEENMEILQQIESDNTSSQLVVDVLLESQSGVQGSTTSTLFVRPRVESTSTHGTGCTLSAAISCGLARGLSCKSNNPSASTIILDSQNHQVRKAVEFGTRYTHLGIEKAFPAGKGNGPLNHHHSLIQRIVPQCVQRLTS